MGFHFVQDDGRADSSKVTAVIVFEWVAVHVALQSSGCIVCRATERSTTNFGYFTVYVRK